MIDLVMESHRRDLGGFEVGRVLPQAARRMVGPFVFFDHMGPVDLRGRLPASGRRPAASAHRPFHRHLPVRRRDHPPRQRRLRIEIRPGEVNWMTAGRGITHSERFDTLRRTGGPMHGIQAWVAPARAELEETDPAFGHHGVEDLPTFECRTACGPG